MVVAAVAIIACNGSVAGDDDAGDASTNDATVTDATSDAVADATDGSPSQDATSDSPSSQCAYNINQVDDAGTCHTNEGNLNCGALDPSFDRCVAAQLHAADGGTFGAIQCFDSDADMGTIVCCNGTNPSGGTLLFNASWTCCPGAAPDGGTAACDPDAGQACAATDGGWICE